MTEVLTTFGQCNQAPKTCLSLPPFCAVIGPKNTWIDKRCRRQSGSYHISAPIQSAPSPPMLPPPPVFPFGWQALQWGCFLYFSTLFSVFFFGSSALRVSPLLGFLYCLDLAFCKWVCVCVNMWAKNGAPGRFRRWYVWERCVCKVPPALPIWAPYKLMRFDANWQTHQPVGTPFSQLPVFAFLHFRFPFTFRRGQPFGAGRENQREWPH